MYPAKADLPDREKKGERRVEKYWRDQNKEGRKRSSSSLLSLTKKLNQEKSGNDEIQRS